MWEWWSGTGTLSRTAQHIGLTAGPPVSKETGWDISLPHHQTALLHLQALHEPWILFGSPVCAPWSQACTTMEDDLKIIIRELEESTFSFYAKCCLIQHRNGRFYMYEQPRNSKLIQTETAVELENRTSANTFGLCMCMHGLQCPVTKKPYMKPTVLKGTVNLTERTMIWCNGSHAHEPLNGSLPSGGLRTASAQAYTVTFCKRLSRDMRAFLFSFNKSYFPTTEEPEDDLALEDPYLDPLRVRQQEFSEPRPKRAPKPGEAARAGSSNDADKAARAAQAEREFAEEIQAGEQAADALEVVAQARQQAAAERKRERNKPGEPISDLVEVPLPPDPEPVTLMKFTPVVEENIKTLNEIRQNYNQRIAAGVTATIQAGKRLKLLQELFGTPHKIQIVAAVIAKKPKATEPPEPLVSRTVAPKLCEIVVMTEDKWLISKWVPYNTTWYNKRKIPQWAIYLYGKDRDDSLILQNPYEELAQLQQDALQPLRTLPKFLEALVNGTAEEKTTLIMGLHKRMYHRGADELRKMLHKSGVPLNILSQIEDIVNSCPTCRAFAQPGAKPLAKLTLAGRFNQVVYFDLVFFDNVILFVGVDECTRYTVVAVTEYKSYDSLETAFRRHWVSHFGPCRKFRADKESVFASDKFAVYCARLGIELELIMTGQQHNWLGILDRRVQILRRIYPKLLRDLSDEHMMVEAEDVAAEVQYAMNTGFTVNGTTPYLCLYGAHPAPLFEEDCEMITPEEAHGIFYEHLIVRSKAIAMFHQSIIDARIERSLAGRPRTNPQQTYVPGQSVDFFRRAERKQLEGWRGPATVLSLLSDGYLSIRWQSQVHDVPVNLIRPHIFQNSIQGSPATVKAAPVNAGPISDERAEAAHIIRCEWESYWLVESTDTPLDEPFNALVSVASALPPTAQQIHGVANRKGVIMLSDAAIRDSAIIFNLGKATAAARAIPNYMGVMLAAGRRQLNSQPGVREYHVFWWIGNSTTATLFQANIDASKQIDFVTGLEVDMKDIVNLHCVVIFEGPPVHGPPLHELLKLPEPEDPPPMNPGRVRIPAESFPKQPEINLDMQAAPKDNMSIVGDNIDELGTTVVPSEFTRDAEDVEFFTPDKGEVWCYSESGNWIEVPSEDITHMQCYPVDRATRPATKEELKARYAEFRIARIKELKSWVDNKTGTPRKRNEWEQQTGRRAIPSRWVDTWKLKGGLLIAKSRLCLKGFAEPISTDEAKASPTANRVSHRMVKQQAVQNKWLIASLDVAVAFLKGYTFSELEEQGSKRKPVSFIPAEEVWQLLAEIDPAQYAHVLEDPASWVFALEKAAYGLRDAPLLWHLKAVETLRKYNYKALLHDSCTFVLRNDVGELTAILTLHVDDLLVAGSEQTIKQFQEQLSSVFGPIALDYGPAGFKHFGVDEIQDLERNTIMSSQRRYVDELTFIGVPTKCLKTAECPADKVTEYRATVSAIAWVGVTSPIALASASMLQGCLPKPTWADIVKLNNNLQQLKDEYMPMIFQRLELPLRILNIADSSFGNSNKYSQGGYITAVCTAHDDKICGTFCVLDFKSNKSKRVATSTQHAEALSSIAGVEAATFVQSYFLELQMPSLTTLQFLSPENHDEIIPICSISDCRDLHEVLTSPAQPTMTNKHLSLYIAALREFHTCNRITAWIWCDTRDMIANCLTKLNDDGTANLSEIKAPWKEHKWNLQHPFQWLRTWSHE